MKKLAFLVIAIVALTFFGCDNSGPSDVETWYYEMGRVTKETYDKGWDDYYNKPGFSVTELYKYFVDNPAPNNSWKQSKKGVTFKELEEKYEQEFGHIGTAKESLEKIKNSPAGYIGTFSLYNTTDYGWFYAKMEE